MLIAHAASHFEAFLSAFKMSVDRNGFYLRLLSYYEYKMHLPNLILISSISGTERGEVLGVFSVSSGPTLDLVM